MTSIRRRGGQSWLGTALATIAICALAARAAYTLRKAVDRAAPATSASAPAAP